jgi:O-antigen/teichoic acid export membrane protein
VSIASNSRWNLLGFGCTLAAHLITVPVVIDRIGLGEFGRAGLVVAIWMPLFVGAVLGMSVVRLVSSTSERFQNTATRRALNSALFLCLPLCLALATLVIAAAPPLVAEMTPEHRPTSLWRSEFLVAGIGWMAQQYGLLLQGASAGRRNYRAVAEVNAATAIVNIVAVLLITRFLPGSLGYLLAITTGFVANLLFWVLVTAKALGPQALRHARRHRSLRELVHFGKWQGVTQVVGTLGNQVDRYILGAIASASQLGKFNAAFRLQEAVYALIMKGGEVLFPYFGAHSTQELKQQAEFFVRASWVMMVFNCALLVPAIPLADPIIRLWASPEVADGGAWFLKILILGGVIGSATNVATYFLMGSGQARPLAYVSMVYSLGIIVGSAVLLTVYGAVMAGMGIVLASLVRVCHSGVLIRRYFQGLISVPTLLNSTLLPMCSALLLAALLELTPLENLQSWPGLLLALAAVGTLTVCIAVLAAALTAEGRSWIRGAFAAARLGMRYQS